MEEYKIISGLDAEVQRILNQWKHQYKLNIISFTSDKSTCKVLLTRQEK